MRLPKLCRQKLRNRAFVRNGEKRIYLGKWGDPRTEANYRAYINELTAPVPRVKEEGATTTAVEESSLNYNFQLTPESRRVFPFEKTGYYFVDFTIYPKTGAAIVFRAGGVVK